MRQLLNGMNLSSVLCEVVDWRYKGFPPIDREITVQEVGQQGWNALSGDLLFPVMVLKQRALQHNIDLMARFCKHHGVSLAPHGKTPMAPQIVALQLEAGAWGVTAATIRQAQVFRAFGTSRILLANELLEPKALQWVAEEFARDPGFELLFLVDSVEGVASITRTLDHIQPRRLLSVLVELGVVGGRAGCRTLDEGVEVAAAVKQSPYLRLVGVEGYEGVIGGNTIERRLMEVDHFLVQLRELTVRLDQSGLFTGVDEIIVSAGGSIFFDQVIEQLGGAWELSLPVRLVLRAGSYVTHDCDTNERFSPLAGRGTGKERLEPALEIWGMVLSRPEPDLAIVGFGKRDVSYDLHLPIPFTAYRSGRFLPIEAVVTALNDQHAYLKFDPLTDLAVGDLVGSGISHPCTAFDKWRLIPLADDNYQVIGAIQTFF